LSSTVAGIAFLVLLVAALAAVHVPLGDYTFGVYTSPRDSKVEKAIYRIVGIDPKTEQSWRGYARNVLAFSAVGVLLLFFFELFQDKPPLHLHDPATKVTPSLAWNNTTFYNTALGLTMLPGRYSPMILVPAMGSSLARQGHTPASIGTLPTHPPQFIGLVAAVTVILCALTFLPALALGPLPKVSIRCVVPTSRPIGDGSSCGPTCGSFRWCRRLG
jgi:K+-transporting ATPase A subunit